METERPGRRRRRSRKRARKKQITWLAGIALAIGVLVWSRILIDRHNDATMFANVSAPGSAIGIDAGGAQARPAAPAGISKNVILFVGNGFGIVPMTATRIYAGGENAELAIDRLPETALVRTASRNAQSADSAAAMTAYMTGVRVDNEVLSQSADTRPYDDAGRPHAMRGETTCPVAGNGKPVTTLLELAKASGRAAGLVTTARVTEAVTAATYAHLCQRAGENSIAAQLVPGGASANPGLGEGVDVVLGGGWQAFLPKDDPRGSTRADGRDLFAELRAKGYTVIGRRNELGALAATFSSSAAGATSGAAPVRKLIGLFNRSEMGYDSDRVETGEPSLAEMTARAIDLLQRNSNGYLLVVEGGRIGDALDASLARKALADGRAFDDAVALALEKVRMLDPDLKSTTLVVTADRDHTLVMNGNSTLTDRTLEARPGVAGVLRGYADPAQSAQDAGGRPYTTLVLGAGEKRVKGPRSQAPALLDIGLADRNSRYEAAIELARSSGGTDVMLGATGANAARFHGTLENTDVFALLREAMGL